jgi:hypothetical protein
MRRATVSVGIVAVAVWLGSMASGSDAPAKEIGVKISGVVYAAAPADGKAGARTPAAGAAVHLRDLPAGWKPEPSVDPVELKFVKKRLVPEFACIQVGQKLVVKCPEGEIFRLSARSRARGEFGQFPPPDPKVFTDSFPNPDDFVSLVCAIHPTAMAHIQVVPTPGFVLCDAEGKFTLPKRLPKGEHVLRGFLPGKGWGEKAIRLQGYEGDISVELQVAPRKAPVVLLQSAKPNDNEELRKGLTSRDKPVRMNAVTAALKLDPPELVRMLPALSQLLHDTEPSIRYSSTKAMRRCAAQAGPFVPDLIRLLNKEEDSGATQEEVVSTLIEIGEPAVRPVIRELQAARGWSSRIRRQTTRILGGIGPRAH